MIRFENDPKLATAPAAVVLITQKLDPDLDFSTFRLGALGFGDVVLTESIGKPSFRKRLDLRASSNILLDISASIDNETGELVWEFKSIDPLTGEVPINPFQGFLPPNVAGSEGQGFVSYSIKPKANLSTGTRIDATASIVFDQNEAIETPPIFNTIDSTVPISSVQALPSETYPGLTVSWSGSDQGAGIEQYDVYFSVDDGPITPWLIGTELTSSTFYQAVPGSKYAFYSVATDFVGYREAFPSDADASTRVIESSRIESVVSTKRSLKVAFSSPLPLQSLIDNNTLSSILSVRNELDQKVSLSGLMFVYDEAARVLTMNWSNELSVGDYSFVIEAEKLTDSAGSKLSIGFGGTPIRIRVTSAGTKLTADGSPLLLPSSNPSYDDIDGDGLKDLIASDSLELGSSKARFYRNLGTAEKPSFGSYTYLQGIEGALIINDSQAQFRLHDWNGDGEKDLVVGRGDGRVEVLININTSEDPIFGYSRFFNHSN
jgi:hypothetical protein